MPVYECRAHRLLWERRHLCATTGCGRSVKAWWPWWNCRKAGQMLRKISEDGTCLPHPKNPFVDGPTRTYFHPPGRWIEQSHQNGTQLAPDPYVPRMRSSRQDVFAKPALHSLQWHRLQGSPFGEFHGRGLPQTYSHLGRCRPEWNNSVFVNALKWDLHQNTSYLGQGPVFVEHRACRSVYLLPIMPQPVLHILWRRSFGYVRGCSSVQCISASLSFHRKISVVV